VSRLVKGFAPLLDVGTAGLANPREVQRVRLVNRVAVFVSVLLVPYLAAFWLAGRSTEAAVQLAGTCALLGSVWLNARGRYAAARVVTLLTGDVLVGVITLVLGRGSGVGLYAAATMVAPLIFYPGREWRTIGAFCTLTFVSSLVVDEWLLVHGALAPLPASSERWFYAATHALSLLTVFVFVLYLYLESRRFEARLVAANEAMERLAETDVLTGVANRRKIERTLLVEWRRAARGGYPVAVVMIDVDHFKQLNDRLGHPAGDAALAALAGAFAHGARRVYDLVGRYGGEEFVIVLPQSDAVGAAAAAERARLAVRALGIEHAPSGVATCVTCSFGVAAMSPAAGGDPEELLRRADAALYAAKAAGRDRVEVAPAVETTP